MDGSAPDPLWLGQRVVAILETGLRTATYKLAPLMGLLGNHIQNMPERTDNVLSVPIPDLAHRVLEIYWQQVRPFDGHGLRQSTQPRARILVATNALREEALVEQLQPNDLVIPGQRVTDHLKDHEVDFVVAIEGAGIVCLEVKGGEVWHDGHGWRQKRGGRDHSIEPVRQAREACYALRDYIEKDPRWSQGRLRWDHIVVLPNTELPDDFALSECPRWKVIDRNDLPTMV